MFIRFWVVGWVWMLLGTWIWVVSWACLRGFRMWSVLPAGLRVFESFPVLDAAGLAFACWVGFDGF